MHDMFSPIDEIIEDIRDGRMVITDVSQQQVLLLDPFMQLQMRVGAPGSGDDQFADPAGRHAHRERTRSQPVAHLVHCDVGVEGVVGLRRDEVVDTD